MWRWIYPSTAGVKSESGILVVYLNIIDIHVTTSKGAVSPAAEGAENSSRGSTPSTPQPPPSTRIMTLFSYLSLSARPTGRPIVSDAPVLCKNG